MSGDLFNRLMSHSNRGIAEERRSAEERLRRAIRTNLGRFTIDANGHNLALGPEVVMRSLEFCSGIPGNDTSIDEVTRLAEAIEGGSSLPATTHQVRIHPSSGYDTCYWCLDHEQDPDQKITYLIDGNKIIADRACPTAPGPFIVGVKFPSGEVAVGRDLRSHFPGGGAVNGDSLIGVRRAMQRNAEKGLILARTGEMNDLHQDTDGILYVGRDWYEDGPGDAEDIRFPLPGTPVLPTEGARQLGNGHWWCFADSDRIPSTETDVWRIHVKPGAYEVTFHYLDRDWERDPETVTGPRTMVTIRRAAEA